MCGSAGQVTVSWYHGCFTGTQISETATTKRVEVSLEDIIEDRITA